MTLFTVASGIVLLEWAVPPRRGLALEFAVAIALVILGVVNLREHRHDGAGAGGTAGPSRAFLMGLVHGLAGSAAVALVVAATVGDPRWACAYLLTFGAGTVIGMTAITTGVAWPIASTAARWRVGSPSMRLATGALSIAMGVWLAYDTGWNDGLFPAAAIWTPR